MRRIVANPAATGLETVLRGVSVPGIDTGALRVEPNLSGVPAESCVTVRTADGRPDVERA